MQGGNRVACVMSSRLRNISSSSAINSAVQTKTASSDTRVVNRNKANICSAASVSVTISVGRSSIIALKCICLAHSGLIGLRGPLYHQSPTLHALYRSHVRRILGKEGHDPWSEVGPPLQKQNKTRFGAVWRNPGASSAQLFV